MSGPPPNPPLGLKVTTAEIRAVVATPTRFASGAWSSFGALLGLIVDLSGVIPVAMIPERYQRAATVVFAVAGFLLNRFFHDSYRAVPDPAGTKVMDPPEEAR